MALAPGRALRAVFGETLAALAEDDPRIVVVDGDVASSSGAEAFDAAHPDRFIQAGIAEQNMLGLAAGLATVGFIPVVSGFACFVVGRAFDSIRVLIDQPALGVKIAGGYTGLLTGRTGKTHQMFNDVALMRTLPNMTVLAPADEVEARQALRAMIEADGPVYIQITREASPILFDGGYSFRLGRAVIVRQGRDVSLVSTGVQTTRVVQAADLLSQWGIDAGVLHVPTIKPLDEAAIVDTARATGLVVVVEEHSTVGGLGSAVAELLSEKYPVPVGRLGIRDCYGESGPNEALLDKYRLSASAVAADVRSWLSSRVRPDDVRILAAASS
jgi:transketolase